jgi:hypothetical protein
MRPYATSVGGNKLLLYVGERFMKEDCTRPSVSRTDVCCSSVAALLQLCCRRTVLGLAYSEQMSAVGLKLLVYEALRYQCRRQ